MKKIIVPMTIASLALCGCASAEVNAESTTKTVNTNTTVSAKTSAEYPDTYDDSAVKVALNGDSVETDSNSLKVEGITVTITKPGTYVFTGTLNDGKIIVDTEDKGTVHIVLNGTEISCDEGPVINVQQAEETVITAYEGTENTLTSTNSDSDDHDACIYSKDAIVINGSGTLNITADGDGIHDNDEAVVLNVTLNITAGSDGIDINDAITIQDAAVTITTKQDGVKCGDDEDTESGDIVFQGGSLKVDAGDDAVQSSRNVTVEDTELDLTSGGGSANAAEHANDFVGPGGMQGGSGNRPDRNSTDSQDEESAPSEMMPGGRPGQQDSETTQDGTTGAAQDQNMPEGRPGEQDSSADAREMPGNAPQMNEQSNAEDDSDETTKAKGIKADGTVTFISGIVVIDSADDAVNANVAAVQSGSIKISAGDDGMHADDAMTIDGGTILINKSYEGLEAKTLTINDGEITLTASDDGINTTDASAGNGMQADDSMLVINGGTIVINADGDGIDMNGSGEMNGGTVTVYGPESSRDGALDFNGTFNVNGGTLIAGGSSGMAQTPSDGSTVNVLAIGAAGDVEIKDSTGTTVFTYSSGKSFEDVVIASENLKTGETYTVYVDGSETGSVTITSGTNTLNRTAGGMNGIGGGRGGMHGNMNSQNAQPGQWSSDTESNSEI